MTWCLGGGLLTAVSDSRQPAPGRRRAAARVALGPVGSVGVTLAPEQQGEPVTGSASLPPARSEHVGVPGSQACPEAVRNLKGAAGSKAVLRVLRGPQGGEREWPVRLKAAGSVDRVLGSDRSNLTVPTAVNRAELWDPVSGSTQRGAGWSRA